jgi:pyruvate formate lyase activating enzyme
MKPPGSPVYAFLRNPSMVDFPGRVAAVFFLGGCNFRCGFCHNADLVQPPAKTLSRDRLEAACARLQDNWADAAVVTGGEPTLWEDLPDLMRFFKGLGWAVKLDTNGSRPGMVETCLPLADYVAMDVKAGPDAYEQLTGFGDVAALQRSIASIAAGAADYEFRTTVIESFHTDAQMRAIGSMIRGARRYVMQPFVPKENLPDPRYTEMQRTSPDRLKALADVMAEYADEVSVRGA